MFHAGYERSPLPPARLDTGEQPVPAGPEAPPAGPAGRPGRVRQSGGTRQRDAFFDNAKYLAIVLVVVGHTWGLMLSDSRAVNAAYNFLYTFHMPAFIVISGYFSRSFDMRPDRLRRLVTGVVVPYVVFETAYTLLVKRRVEGVTDYPVSLLDPWYLTWFLVALFVWRLTTPLWKIVRWPVPLALAISLLASASPDIGNDLDFQRVLQFLPFFVIGLCLRPEHFELVRRREARLLAVPVMAVALAFSYWAAPRMNFEWFYHRDSGPELGVPWWVGVLMNLALLGCSLLLTACFLALVPRRHMWFTALGAGTLYGYLLHGFLIRWLRAEEVMDTHAWLTEPLGILAVTAVAAAVGTLLCTGPVQRTFRFVMEPRMAWFFRKDAAEAARERAAGQGGGGADVPAARVPASR
ncbi:acyltransferase family protein [Streptomyces glaucosporus]|uniref:Acyltransferase family protein n=1 Tax=Streptomyces glaucosporus TaxID=284044 RepID=A0ABN3HW47_9ACTN